MQTHITITIESARFFETTLGVFSQRSTFFTSSNHGLQRKGERDKAGADMGVDSLKPYWVLFATLHFITSSNHGVREKDER